MVSLVLNRRLNYRNIQLTSDTKNQHVGYDAGDGEAKYVLGNADFSKRLFSKICCLWRLKSPMDSI